eukprot:4877245-Pleurochrysis_carterae.AAC.1
MPRRKNAPLPLVPVKYATATPAVSARSWWQHDRSRLRHERRSYALARCIVDDALTSALRRGGAMQTSRT